MRSRTKGKKLANPPCESLVGLRPPFDSHGGLVDIQM